MTSECLFCRIVAGEIPATRVFEDDQILAFRDINPVAPTHILVIPKQHITSVAHADDSDSVLMGQLLLGARRIAADQGLAEDGYRLVINTGDDGGQTVYHIHLHILGGRAMSWPPG